MPPDAKSPQPGKSAPQDDENLPKVKKKALKTENLSLLRVFLSLLTETHYKDIIGAYCVNETKHSVFILLMILE